MGKLSSGALEFASKYVSGTFTGTGNSGLVSLTGSGVGDSGGLQSTSPTGGTSGLSGNVDFFQDFNAALWGTASATVQLERSFDGGTTWNAVSLDTAGDPAVYTTTTTFNVSIAGNEPEYG